MPFDLLGLPYSSLPYSSVCLNDGLQEDHGRHILRIILSGNKWPIS